MSTLRGARARGRRRVLADQNASKRWIGRSHAGKGVRGDLSMAGPVASAKAEPRLSGQNPSKRSLRLRLAIFLLPRGYAIWTWGRDGYEGDEPLVEKAK